MLDTKIQVPVNSKVLIKSKKNAEEMGFSSLNDFIRVVLTKLSKNEFDILINNSNRKYPQIPVVSEEEQKELEKTLTNSKKGDDEIVHVSNVIIEVD